MIIGIKSCWRWRRKIRTVGATQAIRKCIFKVKAVPVRVIAKEIFDTMQEEAVLAVPQLAVGHRV